MNSYPIVSLLLLLRANPTVKSDQKGSKEPLLLAAEKRNKEIIEELLQHGAQKLKPALLTKLDPDIRKLVKQKVL